MPFIKATRAEMREHRQERPFESGEVVTFVAVVWRWYNVKQAKYVDRKSEDTRKSFAFVCQDGRRFQFSRLWGSRKGKDGKNITPTDNDSPIRELCSQLPMDTDSKLIEYLSRCSDENLDYDSDNDTLTATIGLREVAGGEKGFRHWYLLSEVSVSHITPAEKVTDAQRSKLHRWATAADVSVPDEDEKWWVAALQL